MQLMWHGLHHVTVHSLQHCINAALRLNDFRRQHASSSAPSWFTVCAMPSTLAPATSQAQPLASWTQSWTAGIISRQLLRSMRCSFGQVSARCWLLQKSVASHAPCSAMPT
jgi:hypothetical protein